MSEESLLVIDADKELEKIITKVNGLRNQIGATDTLRKALNTAGRAARKQIIKDAKGEYAISDRKALTDKKKGGPVLLPASTTTLAATIRSRGSMQDIMAFMTRPNRETGAAAAKVLNSSPMKDLEINGLKAFVTQFSNEHVAIVQREGKERLPVKVLYSPSVPHMLGNEAVRSKAAAMTYDILQQEIERQIEKVWSKSV